MLSVEDIENRVGFHKATIEGANATLPKHSQLRRLFKQVMTELNEILPDGRAKTVAMTQLEDCSMWSHKAVAELAPLVPEGSQDTAELEREEKLREILKTMLLDQWSHYRIDTEVDDREFLARMVRKEMVSPADFEAIYPQ